jgi:gamma-glutamyltranspeptidase/glutathione hydrolase
MNAVDESGLGISLIQSNFHGIGSRIGVGSYGFFLHNRGCGFNLIKNHPNMIHPGKNHFILYLQQFGQKIMN